MATSGTVYSSYGDSSRFYVTWERTGTWNDSTCGSTIKWYLYLDNHNWWYNNAIKCYTIYINGVAVYGGGTWSNITSYGSHLLASGETSIQHANDGTKSFDISFSGWFYSSSNVSGKQTFTLDTIPRASSFGTVSGVTMGSNMTININRNSSNFTHTLWYSFGSKTWQEIGNGIGTSKSFTIPLSLASEIPNDTYGTMTLILRTFNGSTQVGNDATVAYKVYVPDSVVPSISNIATSEAVSGLASQFACYVRYKSKVNVALTAGGSYGSTIKSYSTTINGVTYTGSSFTTGVFNNAGSFTITAKVTDSRGRTATKTGTIAIVDYYDPKATTLSVDRCLSDGTLDNEGTYAKLTYNYAIAPVNNKNSKTVYLQYLDGTTWKTLTTLTAYSASGTYTSTVAFSGNSSWSFRLYVKDYFTEINDKEALMRTVFTLINYHQDGTGVAFGKVSEKSNAVEFGLPIFANSITSPIESMGYNPITSPSSDTRENWTALKNSVYMFDKSGCLNNQPSQYGLLMNLSCGSEIHQLWATQANGDMAHRGGNNSGWQGAWKTVLDSSNVGNYAYEKNDVNTALSKCIVRDVNIQGLTFGNNTSLDIVCENRGVVKVFIGYNSGTGYVDDTIYIDDTIKKVVRNGSGGQTNYVYNQGSNVLTIIVPHTWSYGVAIGSRIFY